MNRELVDPIANAVMYEGYILYPYRPSVKNRQRWTFGGLYPEAYCRSQASGESSSSQTQCLIEAGPDATFEAVVRFLQLTARRLGAVDSPVEEWGTGSEPPSRPVETLPVGGRHLQAWEEAEEREVVLDAATLSELAARPQRRAVKFPGGRRWESLRGDDGRIVGVLIREQESLEMEVEASAVRIAEGLFRLTLRVANRTPVEAGAPLRRDEAVLRSMAATHAILGVREGRFVSLMDPPECRREE